MPVLLLFCGLGFVLMASLRDPLRVRKRTELLLADHDTPREAHKEYGDNELRTIATQFGLDPNASPKGNLAICAAGFGSG